MSVITNALTDVKAREGFKSHMYKCPAGKNTIGYGLNLDEGITKEEAEAIAELRIKKIHNALKQSYRYFLDLPDGVQEVLLDMAYNMGLTKLFGFRKMWAALSMQDFLAASIEILDSKYHRDFVMWASGNIEITRSFKNAEKVRRMQHATTSGL